jgi:ubiquinol-cytochrome c reductase cytochrome c1 subunit
MKKLLLLLFALALAAPALATAAQPPQKQAWSFNGPFGTYDRASLQRGFQIYREVCSACHGLTYLKFRDLAAPGGPGFSEQEAAAIAHSFQVAAGPNETGEETDDNGVRLQRPATLADVIPSPFPNQQAARNSNSGALPPDLSLMAAARKDGVDYVYSILVGFVEHPPKGVKVKEGLNFNPYFEGQAIAMPQPLTSEAVIYADGTHASLQQEAHDVATFLAWAADPQMEQRKRLGFEVVAFLILFSGLLFLSYRKVWKGK